MTDSHLSVSGLSSLDVAQLSQNARLIKLVSPLGEALVVERFTLREGVSELFSLTLDCLASSSELDITPVLNQEITLSLAQADGSMRRWHGVVEGVDALGADGGLARFRLIVSPWLAALAWRRDSFIYQDMSVPDILTDIFADYALSAHAFEVANARPKRTICTQYRESDLAFVLRIMAEEGLSFRFEHQQDDKQAGGHGGTAARHRLVVFDTDATRTQSPAQALRFHRSDATETTDSITQFGSARHVRSNSVTRAGWDDRTLVAHTSQTSSHLDAGSLPELEDYDYVGHGRYADSDEAAHGAGLSLQAHESGFLRFDGAGTARGLVAGHTFTLSQHDRYAGGGGGDQTVDELSSNQYTVLAITHEAANNLGSQAAQVLAATDLERGAYRNRFNAQPALAPLSPHWRAKPTAPEGMTAMVVTAQDEALSTGRDLQVKVQFAWQRGKQPLPGGLTYKSAGDDTGNAPGDSASGTWLRVVGAQAGPNWGAHHLPRKGTEVVVEFLDGDIDRPVVTAQLYNDSDTPPWAAGIDSESNHPGVLSGWHSHSLTGKDFNQWLLDDTPQQLRVRLSTSIGASQLGLGYLVAQSPSDSARGSWRGTGVELRSDAWTVLRSGQGMLISATAREKGNATAAGTPEALSLLRGAQASAQQVDTGATQRKGRALTANEQFEPLIKALDPQADGRHAGAVGGQQAVKPGNGERSGTDPVERIDGARMLIDAPSTLNLATPATAVLHAGEHMHTTSQTDTLIAASQTFASVSGLSASLFTYDGGIKAIAADGPVSVHAHTDAMDLLAQRDITVTSTTDSIEILAQQRITMNAAGASITLDGANIVFKGPGVFSVKGATHNFVGPGSDAASLPALPAGQIGDPLLVAAELVNGPGEHTALANALGGEIGSGLTAQIEGAAGASAAGAFDAVGQATGIAAMAQGLMSGVSGATSGVQAMATKAFGTAQSMIPGQLQGVVGSARTMASNAAGVMGMAQGLAAPGGLAKAAAGVVSQSAAGLVGQGSAAVTQAATAALGSAFGNVAGAQNGAAGVVGVDSPLGADGAMGASSQVAASGSVPASSPTSTSTPASASPVAPPDGIAGQNASASATSSPAAGGIAARGDSGSAGVASGAGATGGAGSAAGGDDVAATGIAAATGGGDVAATGIAGATGSGDVAATGIAGAAGGAASGAAGIASVGGVATQTLDPTLMKPATDASDLAFTAPASGVPDGIVSGNADLHSGAAFGAPTVNPVGASSPAAVTTAFSTPASALTETGSGATGATAQPDMVGAQSAVGAIHAPDTTGVVGASGLAGARAEIGSTGHTVGSAVVASNAIDSAALANSATTGSAFQSNASIGLPTDSAKLTDGATGFSAIPTSLPAAADPSNHGVAAKLAEADGLTNAAGQAITGLTGSTVAGAAVMNASHRNVADSAANANTTAQAAAPRIATANPGNIHAPATMTTSASHIGSTAGGIAGGLVGATRGDRASESSASLGTGATDAHDVAPAVSEYAGEKAENATTDASVEHHTPSSATIKAYASNVTSSAGPAVPASAPVLPLASGSPASALPAYALPASSSPTTRSPSSGSPTASNSLDNVDVSKESIQQSLPSHATPTPNVIAGNMTGAPLAAFEATRQIGKTSDTGGTRDHDKDVKVTGSDAKHFADTARALITGAVGVAGAAHATSASASGTSQAASETVAALGKQAATVQSSHATGGVAASIHDGLNAPATGHPTLGAGVAGTPVSSAQAELVGRSAGTGLSGYGNTNTPLSTTGAPSSAPMAISTPSTPAAVSTGTNAAPIVSAPTATDATVGAAATGGAASTAGVAANEGAASTAGVATNSTAAASSGAQAAVTPAGTTASAEMAAPATAQAPAQTATGGMTGSTQEGLAGQATNSPTAAAATATGQASPAQEGLTGQASSSQTPEAPASGAGIDSTQAGAAGQASAALTQGAGAQPAPAASTPSAAAQGTTAAPAPSPVAEQAAATSTPTAAAQETTTASAPSAATPQATAAATPGPAAQQAPATAAPSAAAGKTSVASTFSAAASGYAGSAATAATETIASTVKGMVGLGAPVTMAGVTGSLGTAASGLVGSAASAIGTAATGAATQAATGALAGAIAKTGAGAMLSTAAGNVLNPLVGTAVSTVSDMLSGPAQGTLARVAGLLGIPDSAVIPTPPFSGPGQTRPAGAANGAGDEDAGSTDPSSVQSTYRGQSGAHLQFVNIPAANTVWNDGQVLTNLDRQTNKPKIRIKFNKPGAHQFTIKVVAGRDNIVYSATEQNRRASYKDVSNRTRSYTTQADGTLVVDDITLPAAGLNTFTFEVRDSRNQLVMTETLETARRFYIQEIVLPGRRPGAPANDVRPALAEFARHGVDVLQLPRVNGAETANIDIDSQSGQALIWARARAPYDGSSGPRHAPFTIAVCHVQSLASRERTANPIIVDATAGPGAGGAVIPLVDGSGNQYYLWNGIDEQPWLIDAVFEYTDTDGRKKRINMPPERLRAWVAEGAANPDICDKVLVRMADLTPTRVQGVLAVRVWMMTGAAAGVAFSDTNLIAVATYSPWDRTDVDYQLETLVHELGHAVGMTPSGADWASAPNAWADFDESRLDKGRYFYSEAGNHCHYGQPAMAETQYVQHTGDCVMYGGDTTSIRFCPTCAQAVKKVDLSKGWKTF